MQKQFLLSGDERACISRVAGIALVACLGIATAGCASGSSSSGSADTETLQTVRIATQPVAQNAPLYLAIDKGYFRQEGLDVQPVVEQDAASVVPSVLNGQIQIGGAALVPFLGAVAHGLPLVAVAPAGNVQVSSGQDDSAILANANSSITRPRDLVGQTVAVNTLQAVLQLVTLASVAKDGGDPAQVKFAVVPFPSMAGALETNRVAAITTVEPFHTIAQKAGARVIGHPYTDALPARSPIGVDFVSKQYAAQHADVLRKFVSALKRATVLAQGDPGQVRAVLKKYSQAKPGIIDAIVLPYFGAGLTAASLEPTIELMRKYGFLARSIDPTTVVWRG